MSSHVTHGLFIAATAFLMREKQVAKKIHAQIDKEDSDLSSTLEHFNMKETTGLCVCVRMQRVITDLQWETVCGSVDGVISFKEVS